MILASIKILHKLYLFDKLHRFYTQIKGYKRLLKPYKRSLLMHRTNLKKYTSVSFTREIKSVSKNYFYTALRSGKCLSTNNYEA